MTKIPNRVILITGEYGAGKSYLAKSLEETLDNSIYLSLATALRYELAEKLSIPVDSLFEKPTPGPIRHLLQGYGQYMLSVDPLYWINLLMDTYLQSGKSVLIIDDIRFFHEWEFFKRKFYSVELIVLGDEYTNQYEISKLSEVGDYFYTEKPNLEEVMEDINKYW